MSKYTVKRTAGVGIGYTSVMVIFVIICLTLLAVLSYTASGANQTLNDKSRDYMTEYYAAESKVDKTIFDINETIYSCLQDGMFDWTFEDAVSQINGVKVFTAPDGFSVTFVTDINDRQQIFTELSVPIDPSFSENENYTIVKRQVIYTDDGISEGKPENVWDGNF